MYFFVPYNISPIQQAIQAGHAALEYSYQYGSQKHFFEFIKNDKTWVILNGGTTNSTVIGNTREDEDPYIGSLDNIVHQLEKNGIQYSIFNEPDLNNALTAVCFIADERVWDWENYPNFRDYLNNTPLDLETYPFLKSRRIKSKSDFSDDDLIEKFVPEYLKWIDNVGGIQNAFLKTLIEGKKLA